MPINLFGDTVRLQFQQFDEESHEDLVFMCSLPLTSLKVRPDWCGSSAYELPGV